MLISGNHWSCFARSPLYGFYVCDSNGTNIKTVRSIYRYKIKELVHFNSSPLMRPKSSYCAMFSSCFASVFFDNPDAEFSELLSYMGVTRDLVRNEQNVVSYVQTELIT